jgi:hypothetical protein
VMVQGSSCGARDDGRRGVGSKGPPSRSERWIGRAECGPGRILWSCKVVEVVVVDIRRVVMVVVVVVVVMSAVMMVLLLKGSISYHWAALLSGPSKARAGVA